MAGKTYIGNSNNRSKQLLGAYYGNSNNKSKKVLKIYIGNSSNKSVKVFPSFPDAYQKCEYIYNTNGTEWINTNIDPNSNTRILLEIELARTFTSGSNIEFIGRQISGASAFLSYTANKGTYTCRMAWDGTNGSFSPTNDTRYVFDWNRSGGSCYVNDSLLFTATGTFANQNQNFYLFATNINGSTSVSSSVLYRLYRFQAWQDNALICEMYPCYEKANTLNVGMYDVIRESFYGNSGTGIFYKGPDVN